MTQRLQQPGTANLDPARIDFAFQGIDDGESIGDIIFFNEGRVPGSISIGNQGFLWDQPFDQPFAGGYHARSPGILDTQLLNVQIRGQIVQFEWPHSKECARWYYGTRPIIEIVMPDGEIWLFSYRPINPFMSQWCRIVPTLLPGRRPKESLTFRVERTFHLLWFGSMMLICAAFFIAPILCVICSLAFG